jgi:hypothetical protein
MNTLENKLRKKGLKNILMGKRARKKDGSNARNG